MNLPALLSRPHRRLRTALAAAAVLTLAAGGVAAGTGSGAVAATGCPATSVAAPILGSWYAQVYFPGYPFAGKREATMLTFVPGGGIVEANPINTSPAGNSGFWKLNTDCSYSVRVLLFTWDPQYTGMKELSDIRLRFVMTDSNHFHSTSAEATVHLFDPRSGRRLAPPITVPAISETTAERFSTWQVPQNFPAQP
jgi:hypothetical protein